MRLARMWDFRSQDQEVLYSVDFVVVDRQVRFFPRLVSWFLIRVLRCPVIRLLFLLTLSLMYVSAGWYYGGDDSWK